jgi:MFS family permease
VGLLIAILPLLLLRARREPPTSQAAPGTSQAALRSPPQSASEPRRVFWLARMPGVRGLVARLPESIRTLVHYPGTVLPLLVSPLLVSFGAALLIVYLNLFFKDRFAVSDIALGRIFAAIGITTGLAALAGPLVSTRIGKAPTIVLTQLLSIPFLLVLGFVPVLGWAVAGALLRGALFNISAPLYDAFAMERTDERARPIVIGLINGAYTIGYLVAPRISTRIQAEAGFGPLFVATSVFYAGAALANYLLFVRGRRRLAEAASAV